MAKIGIAFGSGGNYRKFEFMTRKT